MEWDPGSLFFDPLFQAFDDELWVIWCFWLLSLLAISHLNRKDVNEKLQYNLVKFKIGSSLTRT
jgi:hypothetical protein